MMIARVTEQKSMDTPEKRRQLEALAQEIFGLSKLTSQVRAQARKDEVEALSETEGLTLDLLAKNRVMSVGEIQKAIGVLPAQMSRIIRSLEDKGGQAFISCSINSEDRRKIDVSLTETGAKAIAEYRNARMSTILTSLAVLSQSEREEFMRMLRKIRDGMSKHLIRK